LKFVRPLSSDAGNPNPALDRYELQGGWIAVATNHRQPRRSESPDLQTQLEEILDAVWQAEADWRLDDRIDLSLAAERWRDERGRAA
jgi:hypothetical protein